MTQQFHMPVLRGQIFEGRTMEAIQAFFAAEPRNSHDQPLCALRVDFAIHHEEHEAVTMDARLILYGTHSEGYVSQSDPRQFTGETWALYSELAAAISTDFLAVQNVGMGDFLPWYAPAMSDEMLGKLFSCIQTPDFALLGAEYPPTLLHNRQRRLMGSEAPEVWRRRLMSLILPEQPSAHKAMEEMRKMTQINALVRALWAERLDGAADEFPLAPIEPHSPSSSTK
jgi:hypothetical protein